MSIWPPFGRSRIRPTRPDAVITPPLEPPHIVGLRLLIQFADTRARKTVIAPAATTTPTGVKMPGEKMTGSFCWLRDKGRKATATKKLTTVRMSNDLNESSKKTTLIVVADITTIATRVTINRGHISYQRHPEEGPYSRSPLRRPEGALFHNRRAASDSDYAILR